MLAFYLCQVSVNVAEGADPSLVLTKGRLFFSSASTCCFGVIVSHCSSMIVLRFLLPGGSV